MNTRIYVMLSYHIMLRYDALRRELGEEVRIRILTYHHYIQSLPAEPAADILMTWDAAGVAPEDRVVALRETVRPVCSPAYADAHARTLAGPVAGWSGLTFIDLLRPSEGWASWEDWFAVAGTTADSANRPPATRSSTGKLFRRSSLTSNSNRRRTRRGSRPATASLV